MKHGDYFDPQEILKEFDEFLSHKKQKYEAVLIGSGAMNILGIFQARTTDFDVLDPKIPTKILDLAEEFRLSMKSKGLNLRNQWLNNGPASLLNHLPKDWAKRTQPLFKGKAITFITLGRTELLMDKLWGFCDIRAADKEVILNLKPTRTELIAAADWVKEQEANPGWPQHVDNQVTTLMKELGYEK